MKKVKIGELKTHLSAHIQKVRKGEEILILDREEPVAKIIPLKNGLDDFEVFPPQKKGGMKGLRFTGIKAKVDVVKLLREDRELR